MIKITVICKRLALYFSTKGHSVIVIVIACGDQTVMCIIISKTVCVQVCLCTCQRYQMRQTETVCKNNEFHGIQIWARAKAASIEILQHSTHAAPRSVWKQHLTKHSNNLKTAFLRGIQTQFYSTTQEQYD